jgi:hypothetical protein
MTATESARALTARSFYPIPIPFREKGPQIKGWQTLRITGADVPKYFNGQQQNIGVLLGTPYGLADVDCDCPEALRIWPSYRPPTNMIWGRKSNPASHAIFFSDPPARLLQFRDPLGNGDEAMLIELRGLKKDGSVGLQSVAPGSTHPSGEQVRYEAGKDGEPANIDAVGLERSVSLAAAASLFARYWPGPGQGGHRSMMALAGVLCGAAWPMEDAQVFCRLVSSTLGTEVTDTYSTHAKGTHTTGIPTLAAHLDKRVVDAALGWLGIGQTQAPAAGSADQETTFAGVAPVPYPKPIGSGAYIGIAGRFVRAVAPHTEADPNFVLVSFLAYAGNAFGRDAYISVSGDHHHANLYICGVGPTSSGRKGTAKVPVEALFRPIDDAWSGQWTGGLSSGEGLITAVQDPQFKREKFGGKKGEPIRYEEVCTDEGVSDKRLVVRQGEFAGALKVMQRDGNTLSSTLRDAWDSGDLNTMTKNSRTKATGAHVTVIGNITAEELLNCLEAGEFANGLANRFLWCCSIRSQFLPEGGLDFDEIPSFNEIRKDFNRIHYKVTGRVERDTEASEVWGYNDDPTRGAYHDLTREKFGLYGKATARGPAQVLRLALVYAMLDGAAQICRQHLDAALEVWRYCDESARFIFGDRLGNPMADTILDALRKTPDGLTRRDISVELFGRNKTSAELTTAFLLLTKGGLARCEAEPTGGRPGERWFAIASKGGANA